METETEINGPDSPIATDPSDHDLLRAELDSLRRSHQSLLSKTAAMEEDLIRVQREKRDSAAELTRAVGEVSGERDALREEMRKLEEGLREKEDECAMRMEEEARRKERLEEEVRLCRERIERLESEVRERDELMVKCAESIRKIKMEVIGIIGGLDDEHSRQIELDDGLERGGGVLEELMGVKRLVEEAGAKVEEYKEIRHSERRQLGNSVVSLTEENRDISTLLRIALVEKEAVEKRMMKGSGETKRVAILQRVGFGPFGFLMGSGGSEQTLEGSGAKVEGMGSGASTKSDSSECEEEEVVSLVSRSASVALKLFN